MPDLNIENFSIDKSNWTKATLGAVVYEPKESVKDLFDKGIEHVVGLEHIDSEDIHLRRSASAEDSTTFTKFFGFGDVLFGRRRAYLKKAARANFEGVCSGDIVVMRTYKQKLLPELLPFLVNNERFFDYAITHSAGGLSPRVKFKDLAAYEFLLPPIDDQPKLLSILSSGDNWNEKVRALEEKSKLLASVYRQEHFRKNYRDYTPLGECGVWKSGGTPSRKRADYWEGNVPWFSPKDMKSETVVDSIERITDLAVNDSAKLIPENSLLVVVRGLILAHSFPVALTEKVSSFNQDMKALIVNDDYVPEYLLAFLQEKRDEVLSLVTETTHGTKRLATEELFSLQVPAISKSEQNEFLAQLNRKKKIAISASKALASGKVLSNSLKSMVF